MDLASPIYTDQELSDEVGLLVIEFSTKKTYQKLMENIQLSDGSNGMGFWIRAPLEKIKVFICHGCLS